MSIEEREAVNERRREADNNKRQRNQVSQRQFDNSGHRTHYGTVLRYITI